MPSPLVLLPRGHNKFPTSEATSQRHVLVYFITGNPGFIDYYEPFLSTLRDLLSDSDPGSSSIFFTFAGRNLLGFEDGSHPPFSRANLPFNLESQITGVVSGLNETRIAYSGPREGSAFDEIILVGHSVGSYILLSVFHHQELDPQVHHGLRAGILLFPTVTHIARSPAGKRLEAIRTLALLDAYAHVVARWFLTLLPAGVITWVLRRFWRMPPHALDVTVRWLTSRDGVWQAIHLGKDEMRVIRDDVFPRELWEVAKAAEAEEEGMVPKFFFLFGKNDHWVANEARDDFIHRRREDAAREGKGKAGMRIEMDEMGLPHDFCISHSEIVAEKVAKWIGEIVGR